MAGMVAGRVAAVLWALSSSLLDGDEVQLVTRAPDVLITGEVEPNVEATVKAVDVTSGVPVWLLVSRLSTVGTTEEPRIVSKSSTPSTGSWCVEAPIAEVAVEIRDDGVELIMALAVVVMRAMIRVLDVVATQGLAVLTASGLMALLVEAVLAVLDAGVVMTLVVLIVVILVVAGANVPSLAMERSARMWRSVRRPHRATSRTPAERRGLQVLPQGNQLQALRTKHQDADPGRRPGCHRHRRGIWIRYLRLLRKAKSQSRR